MCLVCTVRLCGRFHGDRCVFLHDIYIRVGSMQLLHPLGCLNGFSVVDSDYKLIPLAIIR